MKNEAAESFIKLTEKKQFRIQRGQFRVSLVRMAARIECEEGNGPHPLPKNSIDRTCYEFLKKCETGDVMYVRELANRLDGLPKQDITIDDKRDLDEMSDEQLNAAAEAIRAILTAQGDRTGAGETSEPQPVGPV